jgi:hypothetical protein
MSGFSAEWLALREPYDRLARNADVQAAVVAALAGRASLGIVDLACGTGANVRALGPRLAARQNWRLVDNDLSLLARVPRPASADLAIAAVPVDLNRDLEAGRLPVYAALSYDGRVELAPAVAGDAGVIEAVNTHQRTDKGFGPALGPVAAQRAVERFERVGYAVMQGASDWVLGPRDRDIQIELLSGWAAAARQIDGLGLADIVQWLTRRRELVQSGQSSMRVGHRDLFASPIGSR